MSEDNVGMHFAAAPPEQQHELKELDYVDGGDGNADAAHSRATAAAQQAADDLLLAGLRRHASRAANMLPGRLRTSLRQAIFRVLQDWRDRKSERVRDVLPGEFSARTLRVIRVHACKSAAHKAGEAIKCDKWTSVSPYTSEPGGPFKNPLQEPLQGPFVRTADYVCGDCKHPYVTHSDLTDRLGLAMAQRSWQRHINDVHPMNSMRLRRAVANALGQGWLGPWQAVSIWKEIDRLDAAQEALRAVKQRVHERKAFIEHGVFDASREEIEQEFDRQLRIIDHEATDSIEARWKPKDLSPDVHELMVEGLAELRASQRR